MPVRASITSFGPDLLAKVLDLNDTQTSSLALVFHYADTAGLPLLDLADLRAVVQHLVSDEGKADLEGLGGLSAATAGVILRELVAFAAAGADAFFGEPELDPADLHARRRGGPRASSPAWSSPRSRTGPRCSRRSCCGCSPSCSRTLPEAGDLDKPKLVFFFDEAHLLFDDASKAFLDKVTQTVRLIRSKGVGIFFVTQTPKDVPGDVLAQLGNRVQHALRAYTPDDAKALKATVSTFPTSRLRPGRAAHLARHRRGGRHGAVRARRAHAGGLDHAPRPAGVDVADAGRRARLRRGGLAAAWPLRRRGRPGVRLRDAQRPARVGHRGARRAAAGAGRPRPRARCPAPATGCPDRASPGRVEPRPVAAEPRRRDAGPAPAEERAGAVQEVLASPAVKSFLRSAGSALGREITRGLFGTARRRR